MHTHTHKRFQAVSSFKRRTHRQTRSPPMCNHPPPSSFGLSSGAGLLFVARSAFSNFVERCACLVFVARSAIFLNFVLFKHFFFPATDTHTDTHTHTHRLHLIASGLGVDPFKNETETPRIVGVCRPVLVILGKGVGIKGLGYQRRALVFSACMHCLGVWLIDLYVCLHVVFLYVLRICLCVCLSVCVCVRVPCLYSCLLALGIRVRVGTRLGAA